MKSEGIKVSDENDATTTTTYLSNSERKTFRTCPWRWEHEYNQRMARKDYVPAWSWFGNAIHRGLEAYYPIGDRRGSIDDVISAFDAYVVEEMGEDIPTIIAAARDEYASEEDIERVNAIDLGHAMLQGYVERWGSDGRWRVIATEQRFEIEVPGTDVVYRGIIDLVAQDTVTGKLWLWDHKTRRSFLKDWSYLMLDDQAGGYLWVAPEILSHDGKPVEVEGIVFNYLRKVMPDQRPVDDLGRACNKPLKTDYVEAFKRNGVTAPRWWPGAKSAKLSDYERLAEESGTKVLGVVSARQPSARYHREQVYRSPQERVRQADRVITEARIMTMMRDDPTLIYKSTGEHCTYCAIFEYCQVEESSDAETAAEFREAIYFTRPPRNPESFVKQTDDIMESEEN